MRPPLRGADEYQPVGHVVLVHVAVLKPPCILRVGKESFVILKKYNMDGGV